MKVITVTNRKGGVGKTTIAVHLAAGLATMGYNIGLVDTDSQGHAALMLGLEQDDSLFRVMIERRPLMEEVVIVEPDLYSTADRPSKGNLYILRGYEQTFRIPYEMKPTDTFLFHHAMKQFSKIASLDYIIIDSQPTISQLDGAIYLATDAFLYVTECEMLAISGLAQAIEQMELFNEMRREYLGQETRVAGIIPNKMRANTVVNQHNISVLAEEFGKFADGGLVLSPLRLLTVWQQASNDQSPVYVYEPTGEAALDAWRIVESVDERVRSWQLQESE